MKKRLKIDFKKAIFGFFFVIMGMFGLVGPIFNEVRVNAVPSETITSNKEGTGNTSGTVTNNNETSTNTAGTSVDNNEANTENTEEGGSEVAETGKDNCKSSLGAIGWLVCPTTGKIAEAVDWLYEKIEDILVINPISMEDGSPIYEIWKYCRGITNIVFIIFLLVVIYSQITGVGISNYGIKRALPKLIIAAVLVNLSFLICQIAVDVSNIFGNGLRSLFASIGESAVAGGATTDKLSYAGVYASIAGGTALAAVGGVVAFEIGAIWMLIPTVLGAIVAVVSGLITIALRQAVVALLIMISPLAMVAYILPNTENLFKKWKNLLTKMLVFYPMFSLLFGAASLAGFAIIASAKDGFGLLLGMAVQIFPLFFSWSLMKMSGTFLGDINTRLRGLAAGSLATNRAWADSHRQLSKQKHLASGRATTPSLRLMQFMSNRRIDREAEIDENAQLVKERGMAYRARRNWRGIDATGMPTEHGKKAYENQARSLEYQRIIERDKNTMNKGLSYLAKEGTVEHAKLEKLDARMVHAADMLKIERTRGEKIEYENAMGFHKRMEAAVNAHMDMENGFEGKNGQGKVRDSYKFHFDPNKLKTSAEVARYTEALKIMEGSTQDVQFAAATAAQGYDTQKKIVESRMQKYFEMTPPTQDVVNRLNELTKQKDAQDSIDTILSGLRVLNQRGDTDLLRKQIENVLNSEHGIELGTHASQALASFLMFEVKDSDPFLRRFGKYINLETAHVYNEKPETPEKMRKNKRLSLNEYVTGEFEDWYEEEWEEKQADGTRKRTQKRGNPPKRSLVNLIEGTSLDNVERTAYNNLDEMLKNAYTYSDDKGKHLDIEKYLGKRKEIETSIGPAFISASLKYLSGSEQLKNAVGFLTGYDEKGKPIWEDSKDPLYHSKKAEEYFRERTLDYLRAQTPTQIFGLRSDYRASLTEHLAKAYIETDMEDWDEDFKKERTEIMQEWSDFQTKYGSDLSSDDAKAEAKRIKEKMAGAQFRQLLDSKGKLEQIYRTRRSGAANNAKDWTREWLGLDDELSVFRYLDKKELQNIEKGKELTKNNDQGDDSTNQNVVFDEEFRANFMIELDNIFGKKDVKSDKEYYLASLAFVRKKFGKEHAIYKLYKKYYNENHKYTDKQKLYDYLKNLIYDEKNY